MKVLKFGGHPHTSHPDGMHFRSRELLISQFEESVHNSNGEEERPLIKPEGNVDLDDPINHSLTETGVNEMLLKDGS